MFELAVSGLFSDSLLLILPRFTICFFFTQPVRFCRICAGYVACSGARQMKLIVEYVADAVKFEHRAAGEQKPELRSALEKQAAAYRKLAEERAKKLGVPLPERPH
jgi:hypothetical protein